MTFAFLFLVYFTQYDSIRRDLMDLETKFFRNTGFISGQARGYTGPAPVDHFSSPFSLTFQTLDSDFITRTCLSGFPNHNLDLLTNIIIIPLAYIVTFK